MPFKDTFELNEAAEEAEQANEIPLLTNEPGIPVVYASAVADVEIDGPNAVITYCRFRGEGAARVRIPVLEVVAPIAACGTGIVAAILARKRRKTSPAH